MRRFRLPSDLSEKQIEADVATFFGWITPDGYLPFRLFDTAEQITGADKKFDYVIPIYMQFKVAEGLSPISLFYRISSPQRTIQKFRQQNNLFHNPTLYFKLRELAKTAIDYQHNILHRLANKTNFYAFYVAPLTLDKNEYSKMLFDDNNRYLLHPFHYYIGQKIRNSDCETLIKRIPFLRAHISIFPHKEVSSANHYYSFSPNGTEIAWHSSEYLPDKINRLNDRLSNIISLSLGDKNQWFTVEEYTSLAENMEIEFGLDRSNVNNNVDKSRVGIFEFGRNLYLKYEIRQILLAITNDEFMKL